MAEFGRDGLSHLDFALLYAPPSFALYVANRDPAMEAITAYVTAGKAATEAPRN